MKTVNVELGDRSYPIFIGRDELGELMERIAGFCGGSQPVTVTTPRVQGFCLPQLKKTGDRALFSKRILVPDGEKNKNLKTIKSLYSKLLRLKVDRRTTLLLVGGGVLGDIGGYAAATYLRGIPYIQLPTTLIAQVDSSIGGKVGVDLPEGKNLVGAFCQPRMVGIDVVLLKTLPPREFRAGLGEVIKYGLIQDPQLLELVFQCGNSSLSSDLERLEEIVNRSAQIKSSLVSEDERETRGLRRLLNFGHTFGHALERLTGYRRYLHGEAIAIGMVMAAELSEKIGLCTQGLAEELKEKIRRVGLPVEPPRFSRQKWLESIVVDKKSEKGMIHFVFLEEIGKVVVKPIDPRELL